VQRLIGGWRQDLACSQAETCAMAGTFYRPLHDTTLGYLTTIVRAQIFNGHDIIPDACQYHRPVIEVDYQRRVCQNLVRPCHTDPLSHLE